MSCSKESVRGRRRLLVSLASLALFGGCQVDAKMEAGVIDNPAPVEESPQQTDHERRLVETRDGYDIEAVADYTLTARVLRSERYHWGRLAEVSPLDMVLAWGPMAERSMVEQIEISQSNRWFYWKATKGELPLTVSEVQRNMANVHMIPGTEAVKRVLLDIRPMEVIGLHGSLVDVIAPEGKSEGGIISSRSRTDTGGGSCEVFFVTGIRRVYG